MGLLPVGVKWEVEVIASPWLKLIADILIFRRLEDDPNAIKLLQIMPIGNDQWKCELKETRLDNMNKVPPTLQLPWEVLQPLAEALRNAGIDALGDSKLAGRLEAQTEHLKDLKQIVLSFIGGENKPQLQTLSDVEKK